MKNIYFIRAAKIVVAIAFVICIIAKYIIHNETIENIVFFPIAAGFVILLIEDLINGKEKKK